MSTHQLTDKTALATIWGAACPFAALKTRIEPRMKIIDTPTFVSDIDLSIIPSTITKQADGSHKVQLSLNGILTAAQVPEFPELVVRL